MDTVKGDTAHLCLELEAIIAMPPTMKLLSKGPSINSLIKRYVSAREVKVWFSTVQFSTVQYGMVQYSSHAEELISVHNSKEPSKN